MDISSSSSKNYVQLSKVVKANNMSDAHNCHCNPSKTRCLKITENVSFNFASEASYIYIVDKSSLKMPKMANLAKMEKIKCDIFSDFQTM